MTNPKQAEAVEMVSIDRITVINPRVRNKKIFKQITSNIAELGLKRPITVTRREDIDGPRYDLVCGQGRLEAYQVLGQREIPALVIEADTEDCLVPDAVFSTSEPTGSRAVSYSRPDSPAIRDLTMWDASRSTLAKVS